MIINPTSFEMDTNPLVKSLYSALEQSDLELDKAELFCDFPLYKGYDEKLVISQFVLVSPNYGIIVFYASSANSYNKQALIDDDKSLSKIAGHIFSRLVKNDYLRKGFNGLSVPFNTALFAQTIEPRDIQTLETENVCFTTSRELVQEVKTYQVSNLTSQTILESISTIQGAKGLIKPEPRNVNAFPSGSKVNKVLDAESSILLFDKEQQEGYIPALIGPQRIRGLAGSGKTVVLAMKAAVTLLRDEESKIKILYTFSTKSLYQHVKRLIQRFYREFDDDTSNLDRVTIMHSWGGRVNVGVYYQACTAFGHSPMTLTAANNRKPLGMDTFDFVCKDLLDNVNITPLYDFVFVDEAQDYNKYFLRLCTKLAKNNQVTFGADVFQNIFQQTVPNANEIYEDGTKFINEKYLEVCYRTPLPVLVCAHAIGLGVYGNQVQKIEKVEHWKSLGYEVIGKEEGSFTPLEAIEILRKSENSPTFTDEAPRSLICFDNYSGLEEELAAIANKIHFDINNEGLSPDDILVMCADDYRCTNYFNILTAKLNSMGISVNNIHAEKYNIKDFKVKDRVTLSTVHKARMEMKRTQYILLVLIS